MPLSWESKSAWLQSPTNALEISVDLDALRARLQAMNDAQLLAFGKRVRELVYPLTYDGDGVPSVSAFSIQLHEARKEWRRRKRPRE